MATTLCFILAVVVCANLVSAQRCHTGEDCADGKCCVTKIPGVFWVPMGSCKRLLKEGEECMPDFLHHMAGEGKYFVKCPCVDGLECEEVHRHSQRHMCINPNPTPSSTTESTVSSGKAELTTEEAKKTTIVDEVVSTANEVNATVAS